MNDLVYVSDLPIEALSMILFVLEAFSSKFFVFVVDDFVLFFEMDFEDASYFL